MPDEFPIYKILPEEFPELLAEIPGKPKRLFVRGKLPQWNQYKLLCVVGSRRATPYGIRACQSLVAGLAGAPIVIISGLALGLDAVAHEAALNAGLPTIAVLPAGVANEAIYPPSNRNLAKKILLSGGALLSEHEKLDLAAHWTFPSRNRIMAGLSHAALIAEAAEESGTLITARLALDFNRDVLCIPHPIDSGYQNFSSGAGGNRLIREGATLVRNASDILCALGLLRDGEPEASFQRKELPPDLSDSEQKICRALREPLTRDELIESTGLEASAANIALSILLIRGLVIERMGKIERA